MLELDGGGERGQVRLVVLPWLVVAVPAAQPQSHRSSLAGDTPVLLYTVEIDGCWDNKIPSLVSVTPTDW